MSLAILIAALQPAAATFALMLLRGEIGKTGVVLPEMLGPEARSIFRRGIGRYGIEIRTCVEALD